RYGGFGDVECGFLADGGLEDAHIGLLWCYGWCYGLAGITVCSAGEWSPAWRASSKASDSGPPRAQVGWFHGPPFGSSKCGRTVTSHDPYSLPFSGTVTSLASRGCRITARRRVLVLPLGFRATRCTDPDGS